MLAQTTLTLREQKLHRSQVSFRGGHHERRAALFVRQVDVGAVCQEKVHYLTNKRYDYFPISLTVTIILEDADLPVALSDGAEQRHDASPIGLGHGGTLLQQQAAHFQFAPTRGCRQSWMGERRRSNVVGQIRSMGHV